MRVYWAECECGWKSGATFFEALDAKRKAEDHAPGAKQYEPYNL
jgi:hypothetical protein